jgi:hypothetical protein
MKTTNQLHHARLILVALGLGITQYSSASLQFNGSNSKAVSDGNYLDGSTHSNYTFEVWIRPYSLGGHHNRQNGVLERVDSGHRAGWRVRIPGRMAQLLLGH